MKFKKALPFFCLIILAAIAVFINECNNHSPEDNTTEKKKQTVNTTKGLNRNPSNINYSKHARCRMECRYISETEVKQVLTDGKINYTKSELKGEDCSKKYAVEGLTNDKQHVRIIFAPCQTEVTVVTVIDLDKEWPCSCE